MGETARLQFLVNWHLITSSLIIQSMTTSSGKSLFFVLIWKRDAVVVALEDWLVGIMDVEETALRWRECLYLECGEEVRIHFITPL